MRAKVIISLLFLLAAYLGFKNLGDTHFWDDEAQVGIVSKNLLDQGKFTGWDGRNLLAYRNGSLLDENLRPRTPPLDSIVAAASFRLLGTSTWAGRFPFVLAGLCALFVFLKLVRSDFADRSCAHVYSIALLACSPVFLLNIRQCRYYALTLLFSLLVFYAYKRYIATLRGRFLAIGTIAAVALFYSHFLICAAFLLALATVHVCFHRELLVETRRARILAAVGLFVLAAVPYSLQYHIWTRPDIPTGSFWRLSRLNLLWWNVRELNTMACLPWSVGVIFGYWYFRRRTTDETIRKAGEWFALGFANTLYVALLSPQPATVPSFADIRYLIASVPLFAGPIGLLLGSLHERSRATAVIYLSVLVLSNIMTLAPFNRTFRLLLPAYVFEVHREYPTAYGDTVRFLDENAGANDTVYAYPEHANYPLMFYTGDKLRFGCLLNKDTHLDGAVVASLDAPLLIEENFPDWIVSFGRHSELAERIAYFSRPHERDGNTTKYRYTLSEVLDVYFADTHRPEIMWHSFGPRRRFDRQSEAVYIFRRSADSPEGALRRAPDRPPAFSSRD